VTHLPPTPPAIVFRLAGEGDRPFVRSLSRALFSRFGDYETILDEYFDLRENKTMIAEENGEPVGFFMLSDDPHARFALHLLAIAVVPDRQSRGLGRRLLRHALRMAEESLRPGEIRWVCLDVAEDNDRARSLFTSEGFERADGETGVYPGGQVSWAMTRMVQREG
jgi:ribosomal protein S18 acetylase RimI-like enzyme